MLQGLLAPLLLAASVAAVGGLPAPEDCEAEMNKEQLQVSCVEKGLSSIPTGLPKDTGILLLASNQLAKVDLASFQHLLQLNDLDLSNNSLKALEISAPLPNLKHLVLSCNGLESLPAFPGLPSLQVLALGHNQLSQLPEGGFRGLEQLDELQLQGNQLQTLPGQAFEGLQKLNDLDLSDNRLESVPPELLSELSELSILRLERNRLERLPDGFFSEADMYVFVYLLGNPWRCDCQLMYLRGWITDNKHVVYTRTTVQENGSDKEVTENEPLRVICQAPPREKGQPVMHFKAACKSRGDQDQEEGEEGGDSRTPALTPSPLTAAAPLTARASSHSPSTVLSPTAAALTTTSTSALTSSMTHSPTTSSPSATTSPTTSSPSATTSPTTSSPSATTSPTTSSPSATTSPTTSSPSATTSPTTSSPSATTSPTTSSPSATTSPTTSSPSATTTLHVLTTTTPVAAFSLSTSGPTAGRSTPTSHVPPFPPRHVTTATPCTPLAPSPMASMPTTLLAPRAPSPATAATRHPRPAALVPSSPSSPRISAPLPTRGFSAPPPAPQPSAHCLCPALPARVLRVVASTGSRMGWLAGSCCLLRLGLYLACLPLVALPTLVLLCRLGCLCLGWYRPAVRGAPGSRLARPPQQWQEASPEEWRLQLAEAPRPTPSPRIYRVCKKFQVGPSRHVTWLLVSLPGSAGRQAQRQARLSSYSLDRGQDTLGAVRVKYAAASL